MLSTVRPHVPSGIRLLSTLGETVLKDSRFGAPTAARAFSSRPVKKAWEVPNDPVPASREANPVTEIALRPPSELMKTDDLYEYGKGVVVELGSLPTTVSTRRASASASESSTLEEAEVRKAMSKADNPFWRMATPEKSRPNRLRQNFVNLGMQIEAAKADGRSIINAAEGLPMGGHIAESVEARHESLMKAQVGHGYQHFMGVESVRDAVATSLTEDGLPVTKDNIVVTSGSSTALTRLFGKLTTAEGTVLTASPLFEPQQGFLFESGTGARLVTVDTTASKFKLNVDELLLNIDETTQAVLVTVPGNPTGEIPSKGDLLTLSKATAQMGIPLVVDATYLEIQHEPKDTQYLHATLSEMLDDGNVVIVTSNSKKDRPSDRVGVIIANSETVLKSMGDSISITDPSVALSSQLRLQAAAEHRTELQDSYGPRLKASLDVWSDVATEWGIDLERPGGGPYLFLGTEGVPGTEIQAALWEKDIATVPGQFLVTDGADIPAVRYSLTLSPEDSRVVAEAHFEAVYGPKPDSALAVLPTEKTSGSEESGGSGEKASGSQAKEWLKWFSLMSGVALSVGIARELSSGKERKSINQFAGEALGITLGFVTGGSIVGHPLRRGAAVHAVNPHFSVGQVASKVRAGGLYNGFSGALRNTSIQGAMYAGSSAATMAAIDYVMPRESTDERPASKTFLGALATGTTTAVVDTAATLKADRNITQQALTDAVKEKAKASGKSADSVMAKDLLTGETLKVGTKGPVKAQAEFMFARNWILALATFGLNSAHKSLPEEVKGVVSPGVFIGSGVFTYNLTLGGLLNQFKSFAQGTGVESATAPQVAYRAAEVILGVDSSHYRPLDNPPSVKEAAEMVTKAVSKEWPALVKSNLLRASFAGSIAVGIGTLLNNVGDAFEEK